MNLLETFDYATGSTAGREHRTAANLLNCQDAVGATATPDLMVGVVSDGCGSQPHSEFGARMTVMVLLQLIQRHVAYGRTFDGKGFDQIYQRLALRLRMIASMMQVGDLTEVINNHLIATGGGVIMTPESTWLFGGGDFVFAVNGQVDHWNPDAGNAPLYPAYWLSQPHHPRLRFKVKHLPTADINQIMFATDGGSDLVQSCNNGDLIPGTDNPVGPLEQLWTNDAFYHPTRDNPDPVGTWLNSLAQNWRMPGPPHHGGLLSDDTSLFLVRRKETTDA